METYQQQEKMLFDAIADSEGKDKVIVFLNSTKQMKELPANRNVCADEALLGKLEQIFGKESVKVTN